MSSSQQRTLLSASSLLVVVLLIFAANLRTPFTSLAPLLTTITDSLSLSPLQTGLATTLPIIAFATISPFAPLLGKKYGLERAMFLALVLILSGILLRSYGLAATLYAGTFIIGSGIAIGNVLLPGLIKRDFPRQVASLTSAYSLTMGIAAAIGSVTMLPLMHWYGDSWQFALACLGVLPLITLFIWLPRLKKPSTISVKPHQQPTQKIRLWRIPLAWQITFFLGMNSFIYYCIINWLPAILVDSGYTPERSASVLGLLHLMTALPGILLIPIFNRFKEQKWIAVAATILMLFGLLGLTFFPQLSALWVCFYGLGCSSGLILGLAFTGLRVATPLQAASMAGMAQSVGYSFAAIGPPLIGAIHDAAGNWRTAFVLLLMCGCVMLVLGYCAGRDRTIAA
jgi:CP family cyanate transporter-like MFS transporter